MSTKRNRWRAAVGAALIAGIALGGCDFITPIDKNPNAVPQATVDQLLTSIEVVTYFFSEGGVSRMAAMWTQQMAGNQRQLSSLDQYDLSETDTDDEFEMIYTGGGLVDMRKAISMAEEQGWGVYSGILKIHQAYLFGMAASVWGAIPYSEAGGIPDIDHPALDPQADVYAAVQQLLSDAISDLQSGSGPNPGSLDLAFGGDAASWIAVAHSLKARFYMHNAEADGSNYAAALGEAQQGISSADGNWMTVHSGATFSGFGNPWNEFLVARSGYIVAGAYGVDLLTDRFGAGNDDPRLPIYYSTGSGAYAGQYIGSPPRTPSGDPTDDASSLSDTGFGASNWGIPIISCAETQLIIAEAQIQAGTNASAAMEAARVCQEDLYGITLPAAPATPTLDQVMEDKYIALFLNIETWNDYKRTCMPDLVANSAANGWTIPTAADPIPGRLYYGQGERQQNPNLPEPGAPGNTLVANANDPNPCN